MKARKRYNFGLYIASELLKLILRSASYSSYFKVEWVSEGKLIPTSRVLYDIFNSRSFIFTTPKHLMR